MFIFHILIVWYYAWIGNLLFGGLNGHSVLYTNWTFTTHLKGKALIKFYFGEINSTKMIEFQLLR